MAQLQIGGCKLATMLRARAIQNRAHELGIFEFGGKDSAGGAPSQGCFEQIVHTILRVVG